MPENFFKYRAAQLAKINSQRRAQSQPDIYCVPTLTKGQVMFVSAGEMNNEPASCYNCEFYNAGRSCQLIGPHVEVRKFIYGEPDKAIEYWPCCSMHTYGTPNHSSDRFIATSDPSNLGLLWINAPRVGLEYSGANCGGINGGDDCDNYCTKGDDKRAEPTAFCRVLQAEVENGAVCTAWMDDDRIEYWQAANILKEQSK